MADENKNQDPEEENKGASNDDDFGLPDFEFEALEDDDEEDTEDSTESAGEVSLESDDDLPSMDDGDLEDLDLDLEGVDLEGIEDIDLDNLDDLGDLDLEDLDLDDLDADLEDLDKAIEETEVPVAASAEKIEDIFKSEAPDNTEEPLVDDGEFYEEESFGDFDGEFDEDAPVAEESNETIEDSVVAEEEELPEPGELPSPEDHDGFDSSIFDDDTEGLDLGSGAEAPIPFAKRDLPGEYKHDEDHQDSVSQAEIDSSKGKFVRIVVLGIILFFGIGAGFLYWNGTLFGDDSGENKEVAENTTETKKPEVKEEKEAEDTATGENKAETKTPTEKPATTKPKAEQPKQTPKQTTPKQTTTKPAASKPAGSGVSTMGAATGQRHIIVGSFLDEGTALAYADKLASQGENPTVIPPFNNAPNYRVAVASYANFAAANSNLERYRETYNGAWILKY